MIEFPLIISPPTISEEEWHKCAEVGFIGYDIDYICPVCDKPINQFDHGDHKVCPTMKCFGCDKGVEPHHIRWPIPLSIEQCRWLVYLLRYHIDECEDLADEDYRNEEGKIDKRWKLQDALELKLMKNARHKLLTSKKTLFDPYTIAVLRHLCDNYLKLDESMLKNPSASVDHRKELAKCQDALSGIRETIDILPQTEKPLCYRCVGDKE